MPLGFEEHLHRFADEGFVIDDQNMSLSRAAVLHYGQLLSISFQRLESTSMGRNLNTG